MILLLRGPASVGKTTIGRALSARPHPMARVDLEDLLRLLPDPEWDEIRGGLTLRNAAGLARNFTTSGYDLLVEGTFARPADLDRFLEALGDAPGPLFLFTLTAPLDVLRQRNSERPERERLPDARVRASYEQVRDGGETRGYFLDCRDLDAKDTARLLLEARDRQKGRLR